MLMMLAILAAASPLPAKKDGARLLGASPLNRSSWVTPQDYPSEARNSAGRTDFALTISPSGTPQHCAITRTSGDAALDAKTCELVMTRARFTESKDRQGRPVASVFRTAIVWRQAAPPPPAVPDLDLAVTDLPPGVSSPVTVFTRVLVDESGGVEDCDGVRESDLPALQDLACAKAKEQLHLEPVRDEQGRPERVLQGAIIRLTLAKPSP
jgi:hypothetical protein